jgi:hypothetical protein
VAIEFDPTDGGTITVRDNAAGIHERDFPRAFRPADVPPDQSGLSEFGMGMKSAACWFAACLTVRTCALGEPVERKVILDIEEVLADKTERLKVESSAAPPAHHFTEIRLDRIYQFPQARTVAKIKEHLEGIYRRFLREGWLKLTVGGEDLSFEDPDVLLAPHYKDPSGPALTWRKDVRVDLPGGRKATGFAAIRQVASTSTAGFALFRRGRLIQGSGDETYRPKTIFEDPNGYIYQRLFGEFELEGFDVSHTKDGFRWEDNEEEFLNLLKIKLDAQPIALLDQARGYRARQKPVDLRKGAEAAVSHAANVLEEGAPDVLDEQAQQEPEAGNPPQSLAPAASAAKRTINVFFNKWDWEIVLDLSVEPGVGEWLSVNYPLASSIPNPGDTRTIELRLSLTHPFMERFAGSDESRIEPLLRLAAALGLSEITARESGVNSAGSIRRNVNQLLDKPLSDP